MDQWSLIYQAIYYQQPTLFFISRYTASHIAVSALHGVHFFMHTMLPNDIDVLFSGALK